MKVVINLISQPGVSHTGSEHIHMTEGCDQSGVLAAGWQEDKLQ